MASLADWIKNQTQDYGQLKSAYPINRTTMNLSKLSEALRKDRQNINFGPEESLRLGLSQWRLVAIAQIFF